MTGYRRAYTPTLQSIKERKSLLGPDAVVVDAIPSFEME
jgi:hypothetical protein